MWRSMSWWRSLTPTRRLRNVQPSRGLYLPTHVVRWFQLAKTCLAQFATEARRQLGRYTLAIISSKLSVKVNGEMGINLPKKAF
jgi:hypothetical protein